MLGAAATAAACDGGGGGVYFFSSDFLLRFWPFGKVIHVSKSQKMQGAQALDVS